MFILLFTQIFISFLCIHQADPLEEILQKYYKAVNQEQLNKVNTLEFTGTRKFYMADSSYIKNEPLISGTYKLIILKNRACYERDEAKEMGLREYSVYDRKAWIRDNMGIGDWNIGKADSLIESMRMDIEGHLYHWKEKKFRVNYEGEKVVEGKKLICLELKTLNNNFLYYYLDPGTGLIKRIDFYNEATQNPRPYHFVLSDYRIIKGIRFPLTITETAYVMGKSITVIHYTRIFVNPKVDSSIFNKPVK